MNRAGPRERVIKVNGLTISTLEDASESITLSYSTFQNILGRLSALENTLESTFQVVLDRLSALEDYVSAFAKTYSIQGPSGESIDFSLDIPPADPAPADPGSE